MDISVIIPIYNEEDNLEDLFDQLSRALSPLNRSYEILFVDDGSSDQSIPAAQKIQAKDPHLRIITLNGNHGQTAAIDAGFKHANGNLLITLDADLQNDPADIPKLLAYMNDYDVCIGWRRDRQDTLVRKISSRIANAVRNAISRETVKDTGCSLKIFKREVLQCFRLYEGLHRFLPTLAKMEGFSVAEEVVNHRPRVKGVSKYGILNRVFKSFKDLLVIRWMQQRMLTYNSSEITNTTKKPENNIAQKSQHHVR